MDEIKIGWGEVSLIPEGRKFNLAGQFYERITSDVESPLTATALALEFAGESAIFCSCDLVSTSHLFLESVRGNLKSRPDIPAEKVMVSAIHTHTGPQYARRADSLFSNRKNNEKTVGASTIDILHRIIPNAKYEALVSYDGKDLMDGEEAHEFLAARVAEAVIAAWDNRKEGKYAASFGRAAVGMCRRVCYDDGSAKMWGDTSFANFEELESGNDSGIEMMFTYTPDGKLTGVVANVACPAQVLEHRNFISSDYWGKVKENLRKTHGKELFVLGICSAAGDMCPRDMIRWVEPETPINDPNIIRNNPPYRRQDPSMFDLKGCALIGKRIANEIEWALEDVKEYVSAPVFKHEIKTIDMPLRRVTIAQRDAAEKAIREFAAENGDKPINYVVSAAMHVHAGTIARYEAQQKIELVPIEVHFLRLGDLAFATNPYELFINYGNKIRARSKAAQTFLIQLSCGARGYLPTKKAEDGSHYSAYVSSGSAGHEGGDLLVRETLAAINQMF